jgi:hypothetical protein
MHISRPVWKANLTRITGGFLAIVWISSLPANAGVITHHAFASAHAGAGDVGGNITNQGGLAATATKEATLGPYGTDIQPYAHAESWGAAGGSFTSLLRASATSWNTVRWGGSTASGGSEWRDFAWTGAPFEDPLRFHFEVTGTIQGLTTDGFEMVTVENPYATADPVVASIKAYHENWASVGAPPRVDAVGWDQFEFQGDTFRGSLHLDIPYKAVLGGHLWGVRLGVEASSFPTWVAIASSEVDVGHSLGLIRVTDRDGHSVAVTFDSGLRLNTVPEPSTSILLTLGALVLACLIKTKQASFGR